MWNFSRWRPRAVPDLLVAERAARKQAQDAGRDPERTPEARAVERAEQQFVAHQRRMAMWSMRIDGSDRLVPRGISPSALAEARRLRPLNRD